MRKWLLAGVSISAAGYLAVANAQFVVAPDRVAVIVRGGEPVRVEQPGLRWRIPWVEDVAFVASSRLHRRASSLTVLLADGSDCRVAATVDSRVADPMLAYRWRRARGLPGGDADVPAAAADYTAWSSVFATALREASRAMTPEAAAQGAIRTWISRFSTRVLDDGTKVDAANVDAVTCWDVQTGSRFVATGKRQEPAFGAFRRFARSTARVDVSEDAVRATFELKDGLSIDRNGRRLQTEGLVASIRIIDERRIRERFGEGPAILGKVAARVETHIAAELRRAIAELDEVGLQAFDPFTAVRPGSAFARRLEAEGLAVDDLGGEVMGYRVAQP